MEYPDRSRPPIRWARSPDNVIELRIQKGGEERTVHIGGAEIVVGRSTECDVVIDERYVSSRHIKILHGLVVEDLESLNGTFLDGTKLKGAASIAGRTIQLGAEEEDVRIQVILPHASGADDQAPDDLAHAAAATVRRLFDPEFHPLLERMRRERDELTRRIAVLTTDESDEHLAAAQTAQSLTALMRRENQLDLLFGGSDPSAWLLAETLAFLRRAEQSLEAMAASFAETPVPAPSLDELLTAVLRDPLDPRHRAAFRDHLRRLARDCADGILRAS